MVPTAQRGGAAAEEEAAEPGGAEVAAVSRRAAAAVPGGGCCAYPASAAAKQHPWAVLFSNASGSERVASRPQDIEIGGGEPRALAWDMASQQPSAAEAGKGKGASRQGAVF